MLSNVKYYGNTSSASIPILLAEENEQKRFKNDIIILAGFGAGYMVNKYFKMGKIKGD